MPTDPRRPACALFDVNVLIALLDRDHVSHSAAKSWYAANLDHGWASFVTNSSRCLQTAIADLIAGTTTGPHCLAPSEQRHRTCHRPICPERHRVFARRVRPR